MLLILRIARELASFVVFGKPALDDGRTSSFRTSASPSHQTQRSSTFDDPSRNPPRIVPDLGTPILYEGFSDLGANLLLVSSTKATRTFAPRSLVGPFNMARERVASLPRRDGSGAFFRGDLTTLSAPGHSDLGHELSTRTWNYVSLNRMPLENRGCPEHPKRRGSLKRLCVAFGPRIRLCMALAVTTRNAPHLADPSTSYAWPWQRRAGVHEKSTNGGMQAVSGSHKVS